MAASVPPRTLQVHTRWEAPEGSSGPAVVYAVEPRRMRIGTWVPPLVGAAGLLAWWLGVSGALAAGVAGAVALAVVLYSFRGATGFYEVSDDGRMTYLGWQVSELAGRRRIRVRDGRATP